MKGEVKASYSVDCGKCLKTVELFAGNKKDAIAEARRLGWKLTKKYGWVCDCTEQD